MFNRRSTTMFVTGIALLIVSLIIFSRPSPVSAQCGEGQPSSCITCHESQDPVADKGEWHIIHASKDICINCHGGNATTMDKELAHQSMTAHPLEDIYTDCHACHPDYDERAKRFAITLGVTPGSCATPTPIVSGSGSGQHPEQSISLPTNHNTEVSSLQSHETLLFVGGAMLILAFIVFALSWRVGHTLGH